MSALTDIAAETPDSNCSLSSGDSIFETVRQSNEDASIEKFAGRRCCIEVSKTVPAMV